MLQQWNFKLQFYQSQLLDDKIFGQILFEFGSLIWIGHMNLDEIIVSLLLLSVHENSSKLSTRIHPKKCRRKFTPKEEFSWTFQSTKSVHDNSPILSTTIHLLCTREFCHPFWPTNQRLCVFCFMKMNNQFVRISKPES